MQNQLNEKHASPVPVKICTQPMPHDQRNNRKSMTAANGKLIDIRRWLKDTHLDCEAMIVFLNREQPQSELSHKLADEFRHLSQSIIDCLLHDATAFGKYNIRDQLCEMDQTSRKSVESLSRPSRSQPTNEIITHWLDTKCSISQDIWEQYFSSNNQGKLLMGFGKFYALLLEVTASAYKHGRCMPVNYRRSLTLYRQAADLGSANAKNSLGCFYSDDELGVERDNKRAFSLFQESTDKGNKQANINLATMHANGWGTQKNYDKAVSLYASFLKKDKVNASVLPLMIELGARSDIGKKLKRKIYNILLQCKSESTPEVYHALAHINLHHMPLLNKYQKKGLTYLRLATCQGYQPAIDDLKEIEREKKKSKRLSKQQQRSVKRLSQPRDNRKYTRP
jgi:hypothetical protein